MTKRSLTNRQGDQQPRDSRRREADHPDRRDAQQETRAGHRPPCIVFVNLDDGGPVRPSRGNRWLPPDAPPVRRDPDFDLEHQTLAWEWERRSPSHWAAVRGLAHLLRALEEGGFIERITIRQASQPVRRVFKLTEPGVEFADILAGKDLPRKLLR